MNLTLDKVSLALVDGVAQTVRIFNAGAALTAKVFLAGFDGAAPVDCTNQDGKEAATEGWLQARLSGETTWEDVAYPATFPEAFDDLDTGLDVAIGEASYIDVEFKMTLPESPESGGLVKFSVVVMG